MIPLALAAVLVSCGSKGDVDGDGDGWAKGDCDDADPEIHPDAQEIPENGVDEDCDGLDSRTEYTDDAVELAGPWEAAYAGHRVAVADDLDGDEYPDLIVAAPHDSEAFAEGTAFVLHGPVSGDRSLDEAVAYTGVPGQDNDHYGAYAVAAAGDLDGDGLEEMAFSVLYAEGEDQHLAGMVYVVPGPCLEGASGDALTGRIVGDTRMGALGAHLAPAGDFDGDGLSDLIVGASRLTEGGPSGDPEPGRAYVYLGPIEASVPEDEAWLTIVSTQSLDRTGEAVTAVDLNGDGHPDVVGGSYASGDAGDNAGKVWMVLGPTSGTRTLAEADGVRLGESAGDYAGHAVAAAGDVDDDGRQDVLVGAPFSSAEGERAGRAYLLTGTWTGTDTLSSAATRFSGLGAGDLHGYGLGAVDGGVFVSSPQRFDATDERRARVSFFSAPFASTLRADEADRTWVSPASEDSFGRDIAAGDLTGDGVWDLVVGAPYDDGSARDAGRVYVFGGAD